MLASTLTVPLMQLSSNTESSKPQIPFPPKTSPEGANPNDFLSGGFWEVKGAQLTWHLARQEGWLRSLGSDNSAGDSPDGIAMCLGGDRVSPTF